MTLTLNIPTQLERDNDEYREKLRKAAVAMRDAGLITSEQATELGGLPPMKQPADTPLRQGSPEWKALLHRPGPAHGVVLSLEATSRESIYGDDLR